MLQQIADLVDFDKNIFTRDQIIEEFNHKFINSILKIDGLYLRVSSLQTEGNKLVLYTTNQEGEEVILHALLTIEKVLPKTGLYSSEHGLVYLYRIPKRQWVKSLSVGRNYELLLLRRNPEAAQPNIWNTVLADVHNYEKESIIYNNYVYLHWKQVGKVVGDAIQVTKETFLEEIKELWNQQYQIILGAKLQPQKDGRLILDF